MSRDRKPKEKSEVVEELERLRTKIDMLPQAHRPHLHELANAIGEQYDKQQQQKVFAKRHEAADKTPVMKVR